MFAEQALYVLIKLAIPMWLTAIGLGIWRACGSNKGDVLAVVATGLAVTGTIAWVIRRFRSDTAGLLLEALKATRQTPTGPGLHLVDPQETRSSTHADRRTAR